MDVAQDESRKHRWQLGARMTGTAAPAEANLLLPPKQTVTRATGKSLPFYADERHLKYVVRSGHGIGFK